MFADLQNFSRFVLFFPVPDLLTRFCTNPHDAHIDFRTASSISSYPAFPPSLFGSVQLPCTMDRAVVYALVFFFAW